jgi:hypothetical protein
MNFATPTGNVTMPMACMAITRIPWGSLAPARVPIPSDQHGDAVCRGFEAQNITN